MTDLHLVTGTGEKTWTIHSWVLSAGSRDRSVRLWKVDTEKGDVINEALYSRSVHKVCSNCKSILIGRLQEKVRDVKFSPEPNRIISFSTDGDVRVWDPLDLRGILSVSILVNASCVKGHLFSNRCVKITVMSLPV